jgi:iron complex transport system permease protein
VSSMIYGAVLVVSADLVTRTILPFGLPAGLVTTAIGGPYLIWLLLRGKRKVTV